MHATARCPPLLAATLLLATVRAEVKTWTRNTNYDNPANWRGSKVPCAADRAVFPGSSGLAVLLPGGSTAVRELVLPLSGELLLPSDCRLAVTGKARPLPDCAHPGDAVFSRLLEAEWLLPSNWRASGADAGPATPHGYRVPCRHDTVLFPHDSSFSVRLPKEPVYVRILSLQGQEVSAAEWTDFLLSEAGERQFLAPEEDRQVAVTVTGEAECSDPAGCECVTEAVEAEMCRLQAPHCGPPPSCFDPVMPLGHCCYVCGAYLLVDYEQRFRLAHLVSTVAQLIQQHYSGLDYHVGKTATTRKIQVVLVDRGDYSSAPGDAASKLVQMLYSDKDMLGVLSAEARVSGAPILPGGAGRIAASVLGPLLAVVVLLGLIYLGTVVKCDIRWPDFSTAGVGSFVFARFDNAPDEGADHETGVEAHPEAKVEVSVRKSEPTNAFDNPMFDQGSAASSAETRTQSRPAGQENSVFLELQKNYSSTSEDTAEEELISSEEEQDGVDNHPASLVELDQP